LKFIKKYGLIFLAVVVLGGILYLNRFSTQAKIAKGKELYKNTCANCHGDNGEGLRKLIPPLAGNDYIPSHFDDIPCIVRYGIKGEMTVNGQTYNQPMPGLPDLEADEIKAIMDYMIHEWYPDLESPSHGKVSEKLGNCNE
jgi:mono/diheme cytochrome c family protein